MFTASRLSGNDNSIFPDKLEISSSNITHYKGSILGSQTVSMVRKNIASVHVEFGLLFANITIMSYGGSEINAIGFRKNDAKEIVRILS